MTDHADRDHDRESALRDEIAEILDELTERLSINIAALSEADRLAISSAIDKAVVHGYNRGAEKVAFELADRGVQIELATNIIEAPDAWAQHHGDMP